MGVDRGSSLSDHFLLNEERLVSFVGSGGKTSLMVKLAKDLSKAGKKVAVTTTTKVRKEEVQELVASGIGFVHSGETHEGKLKGLTLEEVMALEADVILVEADGGMGYPIKRLRPHEPVIPAGQGTVCTIVGVDALGRPLNEDSCFNWKGVIEAGIAKEGDIIDPVMVREILYRERGYMDVVPEGQSAIVIVNKVDGDANFTKGLDLARSLYHAQADQVFVTSARTGLCKEVTNSDDRVFGVVLAAGAAERYGELKQLVDIGDGTTMVEAVVRTAMGCTGLEKVILVLGHRHDEVEAALGDLTEDARLDIIVNEDHQKGMSTSMKAGLVMVEAGRADGVAILLGDMPGLDVSTLDLVMDAYRSSCCRICYPVLEDRWGHPVVIRKDLFDELKKVDGDVGARDVIRNRPDWAQVVRPRVEGRSGQFDIDTPKEYEAFRKGTEGDD